MTGSSTHFSQGNLAKLLALPLYAVGWLLAWFVPRKRNRWVFGSGVGVGEGALEVAKALRQADDEAEIFWAIAAGPAAAADREHAEREGWIPLPRDGWHGFWTTIRAQHLVVTHGLGDVNRFAVFRATIVQLWHGTPLKRIHLDSPVTTRIAGPAPVRRLLRRLYLRGAEQVTLYIAGSETAAQRLRSAFRVDPGRVAVLGDPRDDIVARQADSPELVKQARGQLTTALGLVGLRDAHWILYAPTWRETGADPAVPSRAEADELRTLLEELDAHLVIRPHPLGSGAYAEIAGERIHLLGSDSIRDITPLLGAFDTLITDFSSIAIDFALLRRPIVWFAPDLDAYAATRGLYEPLEVTSAQRIDDDWDAVMRRLRALAVPGSAEWQTSLRNAGALVERFFAHPEGGAAERVLMAMRRLGQSDAELVPGPAVFFESYYGRQVSGNPLAVDDELARRAPHLARYWSVTSESQRVPAGAIPVLVGGRTWHAARRRAQLLVVNDWLRYGFRRGRAQTVLQTWHGTMLKRLALGRPDVTLRRRIAIHRESRRWSLMLSQNPHATEQFRSSYAFRGEILEVGYPRDDRLARAVVRDPLGGFEVNPIVRRSARAALGIPPEARVLAYAPTWRDRQVAVTDDLDVHQLASELGDGWVVVARGHTRTFGLTGFGMSAAETGGTVIDASGHPDVNDLILAADILVTDYSSIMFDAAVARLSMLFFVPDLAAYRDRERGFTFDFERAAPGPLLTTRAAVLEHAEAYRAAGRRAPWVQRYAEAADAWRETFAPHDDGSAGRRVVDALVERGIITESQTSTADSASGE